MGKFDGILLCTDLDGTLLTDNRSVSDEDRKAIKYFMKNGGKYTFATGRIPREAEQIRIFIEPNAPMISMNGAAIYDFKMRKFLQKLTLGANASEVIEYVEENFPQAGIEVSTANSVYYCKSNYISEKHRVQACFPDICCNFHDITEKIMRVIFMVDTREIDTLKNKIYKAGFADKFTFFQSGSQYYELLPHGASKGMGLKMLKKITGAKISIGIGDMENDISLITEADMGASVANGASALKSVAQYVTTADNNHSAVAEVIRKIENGNIVLT